MKRRQDQFSQDDFDEMVEVASESANTINITACRDLGVLEAFIEEWIEGVKLLGAEDLDPFVFEDYPNLKNNAQEAAVELDRLTQCQKIF